MHLPWRQILLALAIQSGAVCIFVVCFGFYVVFQDIFSTHSMDPYRHRVQPLLNQDLWWMISRFCTQPETLRLVCDMLRTVCTDRIFLPQLPVGASPIMHRSREKIGLEWGIAVKPVTTMVPLANLLKQADDSDRHICAVIDFRACRGPQCDTRVCKRLLSHVACPSAVRRRVFQLHITNMGPHKPCRRGKVVTFLLGILKRRWLLRVDFLVIHHDTSDVYNADIRQCQQQSTDLCAASGGTVFWQPRRQESPAVRSACLVAPKPPPTALLYQSVDHNRKRVS